MCLSDTSFGLQFCHSITGSTLSLGPDEFETRFRIRRYEINVPGSLPVYRLANSMSKILAGVDFGSDRRGSGPLTVEKGTRRSREDPNPEMYGTGTDSFVVETGLVAPNFLDKEQRPWRRVEV